MAETFRRGTSKELSMSMKTIRWAGATAAWTMAAVAMGQNASFLNPTPYQSVADSPFFGDGQTCFELEDFQSGGVSTPGLTIPQNQGTVTSPAGVVGDSGTPLFGLSSDASVGVLQLDFNQVVLGALPTKVGFVWTRGSNGTITVTVTNSLGAVANRVYEFLAPNLPGNGADDQFIGVEWASGIQTISILFNPVFGDIDHVQFDVPNVDSDNDGTLDCNDLCPDDPAKVEPGVCGCGVSDVDADGNGTPDCNDTNPTGPVRCDLDGDGVSDIILQHRSKREVSVWYMNADGSVAETETIVTAPRGYLIVAVADLTGDGVPEFVFERASKRELLVLTLADAAGATLDRYSPVLNAEGIPLKYPVGWTIQGSADFDGDGDPDLLARNRRTGKVGIFRMQGTGFVEIVEIDAPRTAKSWAISAVYELGAPSELAIIFQQGNRRMQRWTLANLALSSEPYQFVRSDNGKPLVTPTGFRVVGARRFDGDVVPSLILQSAKGVVTRWRFDLEDNPIGDPIPVNTVANPAAVRIRPD